MARRPRRELIRATILHLANQLAALPSYRLRDKMQHILARQQGISPAERKVLIETAQSVVIRMQTFIQALQAMPETHPEGVQLNLLGLMGKDQTT